MVAACTPPGRIKAGADPGRHGNTCRRWREKTQKAHGGKDGCSLRGTAGEARSRPGVVETRHYGDRRWRPWRAGGLAPGGAGRAREGGGGRRARKSAKQGGTGLVWRAGRRKCRAVLARQRRSAVSWPSAGPIRCQASAGFTEASLLPSAASRCHGHRKMYLGCFLRPRPTPLGIPWCPVQQSGGLRSWPWGALGKCSELPPGPQACGCPSFRGSVRA